jgi:tetratricopeptide (TPR) repeat protein
MENAPAQTEPAVTRQPSITPVVRKQPAPQVTQPAGDPEQRALQLQRQGKYQEAVSAYREALNQTSDSGRVYQQIALCYQRLNQHDMAIDNYNRAIRSYKDQLAAGRDSAEVQRNIRSCEAGIQVSRSQSR